VPHAAEELEPLFGRRDRVQGDHVRELCGIEVD